MIPHTLWSKNYLSHPETLHSYPWLAPFNTYLAVLGWSSLTAIIILAPKENLADKENWEPKTIILFIISPGSIVPPGADIEVFVTCFKRLRNQNVFSVACLSHDKIMLKKFLLFFG